MNVKFYNMKTKEVTEMPEDELAPGCVKVRIEGMDGEYFIEADESLVGGEFKHPPFEGEFREWMADLSETFREVMPMSAEKWEEGFRRDTNAEREIATWMFMADRFKRLTQDPTLSLNAKRDYFDIINQFVTSGEKHVRNLVQLRELSRNEMRRAVESLKKGVE